MAGRKAFGLILSFRRRHDQRHQPPQHQRGQRVDGVVVAGGRADEDELWDEADQRGPDERPTPVRDQRQHPVRGPERHGPQEHREEAGEVQRQDRAAPRPALIRVVDQVVAVGRRVRLTDGGVRVGASIDRGEVILVDHRGQRCRGQVVTGGLHPLLPPQRLRIRLRDRQPAARGQVLDEGVVPDFIRGLERRHDHAVEAGQQHEDADHHGHPGPRVRGWSCRWKVINAGGIAARHGIGSKGRRNLSFLRHTAQRSHGHSERDPRWTEIPELFADPRVLCVLCGSAVIFSSVFQRGASRRGGRQNSR